MIGALRSRRSRRIAALALLPAVLVTLAGCSSPDSGPERAHPSTSPTERTETVYNECIDGAAQIWLDKPVDRYRFGDCDAVNLISADGSFVLGHVGVLTIEGSNSRVTVADPDRVAITGNDNHVEYSGDAPEVEDLGTDNTVTHR